MTREELEKENRRLRDILLAIQYETPVIVERKKDMERALLYIDRLCDEALRPEEIKEMEKMR